jgi:16S rRNA (cytosine967-C5)-methyltransferase
MGVSPARHIAYDVLRRVEAEGAYASDVLHESLDARVKPADAALATEIALGGLRWRRLLDCLLERHLTKPVEKLDLQIALALRMGIYQLRFLEKIPARAAVNESVELVKRARKTSAAGLVNAVLHKVAKEASTPADTLLPPNLPALDRLAVLHSHPTWLAERWLARFGKAQTTALLEANNQKPRLTCVLNEPDRRQKVFDELERAGMRIEPGVLLGNAFAVSGGSPSNTQAFRNGAISIQDEASQAVPLLLDVQPGDRVLDLCAAPGGKTAALARIAGSKGFVVSADRHAHRLRAMRAQFERLKLGGVHLVELDAEQPLPFREKFDRILVDAPCSGTGTLARHPEIRWRLRPEQLREFHEMQVRMMKRAIADLAPEGRLVYSTCSIEPEENEEVVAEALREAPSIRRVPAGTVTASLRPHLASGLDAGTLFDTDGCFRTSPPIHHTDGFFAAALEQH